MSCRGAAALPACSPLAPLLPAGAGEPGQQLRSRGNPRSPPLRPQLARSPGSGSCRGSDVRVWRAPSDSCCELEAGRLSLPRPLPPSLAFFKRRLVKAVLCQTYPRLKSAEGETFNSARSAGRCFGCKICISISPLKKQP